MFAFGFRGVPVLLERHRGSVLLLFASRNFLAKETTRLTSEPRQGATNTTRNGVASRCPEGPGFYVPDEIAENTKKK